MGDVITHKEGNVTMRRTMCYNWSGLGIQMSKSHKPSPDCPLLDGRYCWDESTMALHDVCRRV